MASPSKSPSSKSPVKEGRGSGGSSSDLLLPTQRVKMIMKSCPEVETVPQESLHLITKSTELFIEYLTRETLKYTTDKSMLDYEALSNAIHSQEHLVFLRETIPKKITWEEAQELIKENDNKFEGFH